MGRPSSSFALFIGILVPCNACMSGDSANMHLYGCDGQASKGATRTCIYSFLEGHDGALARAFRAALQLTCHFLIAEENV